MAQQALQNINPITDLSAVEIAQQIKAGHLFAQDVVEAHIQRIEAVNPQLNAVVIPLFEEARAQAVAADDAQRRGEPLGPLHGVPITMAARGQHYLAQTIHSIGACSAEKYLDLIAARDRYRSHFLQAMDDGNLDAVLCPPFALPAIPHKTSQHLFPAASYAMVYNVIGAPAGVVSITKVRSGEESDRAVTRDLADITAHQVEQGSVGLPVGVQVVARHWREDIVLAVMAALEDHFQATPDYPSCPDSKID